MFAFAESHMRQEIKLIGPNTNISLFSIKVDLCTKLLQPCIMPTVCETTCAQHCAHNLRGVHCKVYWQFCTLHLEAIYLFCTFVKHALFPTCPCVLFGTTYLISLFQHSLPTNCVVM